VCLRGGEGLVWGNHFEGYRFGATVTAAAFDSPSYPIWTQIGYKSGLQFGASHTGIDMPYGDGDFFAWDNEHVPKFDWGGGEAPNYNYEPGLLVEGRDFHWNVAKPGYTPYAYPHPRRLVGH
jgi:hypothetical protein